MSLKLAISIELWLPGSYLLSVPMYAHCRIGRSVMDQPTSIPHRVVHQGSRKPM